MDDNIKDKAILETLLERFQKHRLPRLLDIKKNVDQGETLSDYDIEFMEELFKDAKQNDRYLQTADDELKNLMGKVLALYKEITEKAMENEQKGQSQF